MQKAFQPIDNAPLIVFRIALGFLITAECWGALVTGWVKRNFVEPQIFLPHIGFEWLEPFAGPWMYGYFGVMGCLGIAIMLGYHYKVSIWSFTVLWFGAFIMQKTSYNNHYYLLWIITLLMGFLPANRYASLDVTSNRQSEQLYMPRWNAWVLMFQMAIVYFFATVSKFYPDWLNGTFTGNLFTDLKDFPILGSLFVKREFHLFIAYAGILFDAIVIPAFLFKKTRNWALLASFIFHLFNAITLKIGIFPFFALSFVVFFYPPETIRNLFLKKKPLLPLDTVPPARPSRLLYTFFIFFFALQIALPLRHWFIPGDVLWTEEGHRLSWRMMLREKKGITHFRVVDAQTQEELEFPIAQYATPKQLVFVTSKPDGIWQMAQYIKTHFARQGRKVHVYVDSYVSVNRKNYQRFIDPQTDLAAVPWNYFLANSWILPYDSELEKRPLSR